MKKLTTVIMAMMVFIISSAAQTSAKKDTVFIRDTVVLIQGYDTVDVQYLYQGKGDRTNYAVGKAVLIGFKVLVNTPNGRALQWFQKPQVAQILDNKLKPIDSKKIIKLL